MKRRRQAAVLTVPLLLTGCTLMGAPEAAPPPAPSSTPVAVEAALAPFYEQDVRWVGCGPAECATITAPLDYADPGAASVELAITRVPATGERLGSLFVNPGGPGASAVGYAKLADSIVGPALRENFDIVGLDPRGVGFSEPIECLTDEQLDLLAASSGTPDSLAEETAVIALAELPGRGCSEKSPTLVGHVGSVNSARDLDVARAVVGDPSLMYLGKSYGTMLGATYAELFPDRVGRMVLDGALPASLDRAEVSLGQAIGFESALRDFVADCREQEDCPLQGDVDAALAQLRDWIEGLEDAPIPAGDRELNEALAAYAVLTNLYAPAFDFPRLREALSAAMEEQDAGPLLALLDARVRRGSDGRYEDNSTEAFHAVTCLDRPFTGTAADVRLLAEEWSAQAPTFGRSLAWGLLVCRDWPAKADRVTSTRAAGSAPILIVSTTRDPATPHAWGQLLAAELENGHLLTFDGAAHTAYQAGSGCVDDAVEDYLLRGVLPAEGTVCD
jgi:pimeloyl-ACP methyl ester carboxylesterase